jgi:hypothetical protein
MSSAGHVAHTAEMRNAYKIFVGKPEGKRPLRTLKGKKSHKGIGAVITVMKHGGTFERKPTRSKRGKRDFVLGS